MTKSEPRNKIAEIDVERPLPAKIEEAARIEALEGLTITAIAERLEIRRETISLYRNHHPQYMKIRTDVLKEQLAPFAAKLDLARSESVDILRDSLRQLKKLINYEVDGLPVPTVQLDAIRTAINSPVIRSVLGGIDEASARASATAVSAVVLKFEGTPEQLKAMTDSIEIVDGEIVGVTDE